MGALRLLLALSVVAWHTSPIRWLPLPTGDAAVQFFFAISGFYMGLILNEKYVGPNSYRLFIANRFVRIYSVYFLMAVVTLALALTSHTELFDPERLSEMGAGAKTLIFGSNLTIFGLDSFSFLKIEHGALALIRDGGERTLSLGYAWVTLVPQAWTLSLELTFYLVAPLIVRRVSRICLLGAISALLRVLLWTHGYDWKTWNYNFFPTELVFFLMGALLYHAQRTSWFKRWGPSLAALAPYATGLALFTSWGLPLVLSYAGVIVAVPFLFELTKRNRIDRFIGELSYPVYMVHYFVMFATQALAPSLFESGRFGSFCVIASLALSVVIYRYAIMPIDNWRDRVTRQALAARSRGAATLSGSITVLSASPPS